MTTNTKKMSDFTLISLHPLWSKQKDKMRKCKSQNSNWAHSFSHNWGLKRKVCVPFWCALFFINHTRFLMLIIVRVWLTLFLNIYFHPRRKWNTLLFLQNIIFWLFFNLCNQLSWPQERSWHWLNNTTWTQTNDIFAQHDTLWVINVAAVNMHPCTVSLTALTTFFFSLFLNSI